MFRGKRGQEMTLGTIILIVLGIAVLVFLIYGFSVGWGNLWEKLTAFGGGSSNVDTIKQSCALACTTNNKYSYCNETRTMRLADANKTKVPGTCYNLTSYGVESCPGLCSN